MTTIHDVKGADITCQPLILAEIGPFGDGQFLYLSTENLDGTSFGFPYNGIDYQPRIKNLNVGALQSVSQNGIVQSPSLDIELADADGELWIQWELQTSPTPRGFKGVPILLRFVFWEAGTFNFSSDSRVVFSGICNPPNKGAASITFTATNKLNMSRVFLPTVAISKRCQWAFPTTQAQRHEGATDPFSDFWECGYSPDTGDAIENSDDPDTKGSVGNLDPTTSLPYTDCPRTWEGCLARLGNTGLPDTNNGSPFAFVQIEQDQSGRRTGRFGGIRYDPPDQWRGNSYTSGTKDEGINSPNDAKYNDYFPMIYGKSFVQPPVMFGQGDPNITHFEVVVCTGETGTDLNIPDPIDVVLLNDFLIPHKSHASDPQLFWEWVTFGSRNGLCSRNIATQGRGDSYGSLSAIHIQCHRVMAESASVPNIRVLSAGSKVRIYNDDGSLAFYRNNLFPPWNVMDMLSWANWHEIDLGVATFAHESAYCTPNITYQDLAGNSQTANRYMMGISYRQRRSVSDALRTVLAGFKAMLRPSIIDGTLELFIEKTLSDQQPTPIDGSNDNSAVDSAHADGSDAQGYVAYTFDGTNILFDNNEPTLKLSQRPISDTPNRMSATFQDRDYFFTNDTLTRVDSADIGRTGQVVDGVVAIEGTITVDQSARCLETTLAKQYRGNPRTGTQYTNGIPLNDTGGTIYAEWKTTVQGIHLRCGDLIKINFPVFGLMNQLFRLISVAPSLNYETVTFQASWHEDDWYLDSYGQNPAPLLQAQREQRLLRPPFGWSPNWTGPTPAEAMYSQSDKSFGVAQLYVMNRDTWTVSARLNISGYLPVNKFSGKTSPPYAPQGDTDLLSGGNVEAGTYYMALSALGEDDLWTAPSFPLAKVVLSAQGSLILPNIHWYSHTIGWRVFAGKNPNRLSYQNQAFGVPSQLTVDQIFTHDAGMPDVMFDHLRYKVKHVWHGGIWGQAVQSVSGTSVTFAAGGENDLTGRIISFIGRANTQDDVGIWNFLVTSGNESGVDTTGNLDVIQVQPGDVAVLRAQGIIASANTIGDPLFENSVDYYDPPIKISWVSGRAYWLQYAADIRIVTTNPHGYQAGDKVYQQEITGNTAANGVFVIGEVPDLYTYTLSDTATTEMPGDYDGGGWVTRVTNGMEPGKEKNRLVRILSGTGAGQIPRTIIDNDRTTVTIDGQWDVIPDETSVWIIEEQGWETQVDGHPVHNSDPSTYSQVQIDVPNVGEREVLVKVFTVSADGRESVDPDTPFREIFLFGGPGPLVVQYYVATFGLGIGDQAVSVGTDVCPHYIIRRRGIAVSCTITSKIAPASDLVIDIQNLSYATGTAASIFDSTSAPLVLLAGETTATQPIFATNGYLFDEMDVLTVNVSADGGGAHDVTVQLKILVQQTGDSGGTTPPQTSSDNTQGLNSGDVVLL